MKENTVEELRKIALFLESYDQTRFEKCVVDNPEFSEGNFHRKQHITIDPFSQLQRYATVGAINELVKVIPEIPEDYVKWSIDSRN